MDNKNWHKKATTHQIQTKTKRVTSKPSVANHKVLYLEKMRPVVVVVQNPA